MSEGSNVITLRLPKFNWQIGALILIAVVAGFQTFQLARLRGNITVRAASVTPASAVSAPTPAGDHQGLQGMVGGC